MKFVGITALLVALLAFSAGTVSYVCCRRLPPEAAAPGDDALLWLRSEFRLSPDQMARIEAMHAAYAPVCEEHCLRLHRASAEVRRLRAARADGQAITAAVATVAQVDAECRTSLEAHVRAVAAVMGEPAGRRYLAVVLPRLSGFDHTRAPDLDLKEPTHEGHAQH
ncbi:MAG: hypothetical protein JF599_02110 [Verrucomicrobia bacterium]|nr:hypothetical protein [Verrucomicrobiota bacterium]